MCSSTEEKLHFRSIINSLRKYKEYALSQVAKTEDYFLSLPSHQRQMMTEYLDHIQRVKDSITQNDNVIQLVLEDADHLFINFDHTVSESDPAVIPERNMSVDIGRIEATFKHIFRDWSSEGNKERDMCYRPLLDELVSLFPLETHGHRQKVSVLVPGAGLGRLVFEIAHLGYRCQGNEFSLFMMFFSQFLINQCRETNQYHIHPWVHQSTNNMTGTSQIRRVTFPDVSPAVSLESVSAILSMAAGDFLEVYQTPNSWDCVVTCFFIDCAHNIADFIETIYMILQPGGYWINLGPLLYHFSNVAGENSIEPSYDVVRNVIVKYGFKFIKETTMPTTYCQNPDSMMQFHYNSVFFVCQKPPEDCYESDSSLHM